MQTTGEIGETLAAQYLAKRGYKIIERNYLGKDRQGPKRGEIDIVARKNGVIHFIEVKCSLADDASAQTPFPPEERVSRQKQFRIFKTAQRWLAERRVPIESKWQIDIIGIRLAPKTKKARISYFSNVVSF